MKQVERFTVPTIQMCIQTNRTARGTSLFRKECLLK